MDESVQAHVKPCQTCGSTERGKPNKSNGLGGCVPCGRIRSLANYYANKEIRKQKAKEWKQANPDKVLAGKRRIHNAEKGRLYAREWAKSHPEARRAAESRRRQRIRTDMTPEDILISVSYRQAIANDLCVYCGEAADSEDHVVPLSRGGTDHWWNLVRACQKCNSSKKDRLLEEWIDRP